MCAKRFLGSLSSAYHFLVSMCPATEVSPLRRQRKFLEFTVFFQRPTRILTAYAIPGHRTLSMFLRFSSIEQWTYRFIVIDVLA